MLRACDRLWPRTSWSQSSAWSQLKEQSLCKNHRDISNVISWKSKPLPLPRTSVIPLRERKKQPESWENLEDPGEERGAGVTQIIGPISRKNFKEEKGCELKFFSSEEYSALWTTGTNNDSKCTIYRCDSVKILIKFFVSCSLEIE